MSSVPLTVCPEGPQEEVPPHLPFRKARGHGTRESSHDSRRRRLVRQERAAHWRIRVARFPNRNTALIRAHVTTATRGVESPCLAIRATHYSNPSMRDIAPGKAWRKGMMKD